MAAKHTENISRFMEMTSMDVGGTRFLNALGTGMLRSPGPGCGENRAFRGGGQMRGPAIYQQLWAAELRSGFRICSVEIRRAVTPAGRRGWCWAGCCGQCVEQTQCRTRVERLRFRRLPDLGGVTAAHFTARNSFSSTTPPKD